MPPAARAQSRDTPHAASKPTGWIMRSIFDGGRGGNSYNGANTPSSYTPILCMVELGHTTTP